MNRTLGLRLPMYVVDAFTSLPFSGNPAAVCLLGPGIQLSDDVRQRVAAEMNHSETAFVEPLHASPDAGLDVFSTAREFRLRWFTPTCEVPCCGHATVASAAVLLQARANLQPSISFHTLSGELVVTRAGIPAAGQPQQPAAPAADVATDLPLQLSLSLPLYDPVDPVPACAADPGGPLARACASGLPLQEVRFCAHGGLKYVLMALQEGVTQRQLEELRPDFDAMARAASRDEVHGVIVCAHTPEGEAEVVSRFFGPWMGINEDPVTGSAHAVLGPYWEPRLRPKGGVGKREAGGAAEGAGAGDGEGGCGQVVRGGPMRMRQCSTRGGDVEVEVLWSEGRVRVSGSATLVLEGWLRV